LFEDLEKYKSLDFYARQIVEGYLTGLHRSPFHGFSVEFAEHRQYTTGESTRNIDWKLYGRTNKLFVKRFEEETNLRCQLVIDHSGSMLFPTERHGNLQNPNKLTFACYATAVLSELLVRQRDAFGLSLISNGIDLQTDCRSNRVHQQYLLSLLEKELLQHTPDKAGDKTQLKDTQISEALHLIAEQLHKRSLVVIFTDALVNDSALSTGVINIMKKRNAIFDKLDTKLPIVFTADQEAGTNEYFVKNKVANNEHWAAMINSHVHWMQANTKHPVVGVSPFNEGDYWSVEEGATATKQCRWPSC
jgi:uncharacterized protein (DUF58 family)